MPSDEPVDELGGGARSHSHALNLMPDSGDIPAHSPTWPSGHRIDARRAAECPRRILARSSVARGVPGKKGAPATGAQCGIVKDRGEHGPPDEIVTDDRQPEA